MVSVTVCPGCGKSWKYQHHCKAAKMAEEMRTTLDLALQDPMPLAEPTLHQRFEWAERRHLFWRTRCLEHARKIDKQAARICELEWALREIEDDGKGSNPNPPEWDPRA